VRRCYLTFSPCQMPICDLLRCFLLVSEVEQDDVRVKIQRSSRSLSNTVGNKADTSALKRSDPEKPIRKVDQN
jgi:hypothetical protein